MGDLFNNREVLTIEIIEYARTLIERFAAIAATHVILGNHDMWNKSSGEINALNSYKYIPNVKLYINPTKVIIDDTNILFMPYIGDKKEQIQVMKDNIDCHYLLCHSDLNGARMHLTSVANKNLDKIELEEFSNFIKVFSGHIHITQKHKNFTFVGNIFQMDRNDYQNPKGITILDLDDGSETFIENNISPKLNKLELPSNNSPQRTKLYVIMPRYQSLNSYLTNNFKLDSNMILNNMITWTVLFGWLYKKLYEKTFIQVCN
jgi:hypothetical protein